MNFRLAPIWSPPNWSCCSCANTSGKKDKQSCRTSVPGWLQTLLFHWQEGARWTHTLGRHLTFEELETEHFWKRKRGSISSQQAQSSPTYLVKFPKWFRMDVSLEVLGNRMCQKETPANVHMHRSWRWQWSGQGLREHSERHVLTLRLGFSPRGVAAGFAWEKSCSYSYKQMRRRRFLLHHRPHSLGHLEAVGGISLSAHRGLPVAMRVQIADAVGTGEGGSSVSVNMSETPSFNS